MEEGRSPESIFDFVRGITRLTRDKTQQDARLDLEGRAKKAPRPCGSRQLRAQAGRAVDWSEPDLAQRLRHRADLLDARLVDPLWLVFTANALQIAA